MDRDLARRELDGLARPRERVGPAAADLDRAVGRRALRDRAGQPGECRLDRLARRGRSVGRRQLALEVVGRRRRAEADRRAIGLPIAQVVFDDPRRVAQEDRQHAGRERIERAAMPDPFGRGQPADERDDVVRGRAGRLGDDEDAVEARDPATSGPRSAGQLGDEPTRLGEDRRSRLGERRSHGRTRRPRVAAPAEPAGEDRGVDPARLRPHATRASRGRPP